MSIRRLAVATRAIIWHTDYNDHDWHTFRLLANQRDRSVSEFVIHVGRVGKLNKQENPIDVHTPSSIRHLLLRRISLLIAQCLGNRERHDERP